MPKEFRGEEQASRLRYLDDGEDWYGLHHRYDRLVQNTLATGGGVVMAM